MSGYVKHGTGPNDHKKGNRTRGADRKGNRSGSPNGRKDLTGLKAASRSKAESVEHYKEIAAQRANVIRYGQGYAYELQERLEKYIREQREIKKPLTMAGLVRASGVSYDTFNRMKRGDCDHLLFEFMDVNGIDYDREGELVSNEAGELVLLCRLSAVVKNAVLAVQEQLEENCYLNKGNPLGSIAGMRNYFDWQENPTGNKTNNNTLVLNNVATLDEAREAMKRLNG